jgi:alkaline phosphatase D
VAASTTRPLTRRRFVAGAAGAAAALAGADAIAEVRRPEPINETSFASGIAAGVPTQHGATLWTRVDHGGPSGTLELEVARDRDFAQVVARRTVVAERAADHTVNARVGGLDPGEEYFYRFESRRSHSPVGRFRTLRPPDSREPVRIAFWSCQSFKAGYYAAHADIARQDVDFVVGLGDYIYEATGDTGPRQDHIGPDDSSQTLPEYRHKYRLYKSDLNLRKMHAAHAYFGIWDDHEVESSYYGRTGGNVQGRTRRVPFLKRRANGYRAFFDYMPFPRHGELRPRIYRTIAPGRHCELLLYDLHRYASPIACPGIPTAGPIPLEPCAERSAPGRSLLGKTQKAWVKRRLHRSEATWKLLGNSMMMMGLYYGPNMPFNLSQWDGWAWERGQLMNFLLKHGIENVAAFTGDIHTFFAGYVTTTGDVNGRRAATEFIGSSISSPGIPENLGREIGVDNPLYADFTENVKLLNPHIAYDEQRHRGYSLVEAGPDELKVEFRGVQNVLDPRSSCFTVKTLSVPTGQLEIHDS